MASKRPRRRVTAPDAGDELATLHMLWIRADYLRRQWGQAAAEARATPDMRTAVTLPGGYGVPIWASVTLFLASLHTVVEGWERLALSHHSVDAALADRARVGRLQDFRDGVFHFGAMNNPAITGILEDRAMLAWAAQLHVALGRYMRERPDRGSSASID